jgi:hypothetical protein
MQVIVRKVFGTDKDGSERLEAALKKFFYPEAAALGQEGLPAGGKEKTAPRGRKNRKWPLKPDA